MNNYFIVSRGLLFSDRWLSEKFSRGQAWVDLFGLAQHSDSFIRVRGIRVDIKRGQLGYSQLTLAKRWRWSRNKIIRYLKELEKQGDIEQQNNEITTLITITKYEVWQLNGTTNDTTERQQKDNRRDTYKNDKNDKNDKKELPNGNALVTGDLYRADHNPPKKRHTPLKTEKQKLAFSTLKLIDYFKDRVMEIHRKSYLRRKEDRNPQIRRQAKSCIVRFGGDCRNYVDWFLNSGEDWTNYEPTHCFSAKFYQLYENKDTTKPKNKEWYARYF